METTRESTSYYIPPGKFLLSENALGNPDLIQSSVSSDCYVTIVDAAHFPLNELEQWPSFPLKAADIKLKGGNAAYHIYIVVPTADNADALTAILGYSTLPIDAEGYEIIQGTDAEGRPTTTRGERVGAEGYRYYKAGTVGARGSNPEAITTPAGQGRTLSFDLGVMAEAPQLFNVRELFNRMFTPINADGEPIGTADLDTIRSIRANYSFWSVGAVSARGKGMGGDTPTTGGGGIIQRVYGFDQLTAGTIFDPADNTSTFNAHAIQKVYELAAKGAPGNFTFSGSGNAITSVQKSADGKSLVYLKEKTFATKDEVDAILRDNPLNRLFTPVDAQGNDISPTDTQTPIASIRANYSFWSIGSVSARGKAEGAPDSGRASYLHELLDVALTEPSAGQVLTFDGTSWVNRTIQAGGLDEQQLATYLTAHSYAKTTDKVAAATTADKVANALTLSLNGTSQGAWNGSAAKSINITPSAIGAAAASQTMYIGTTAVAINRASGAMSLSGITGIDGGGSALYLGNSGNSSYVYLREDMKSVDGGWSITKAGAATFDNAVITNVIKAGGYKGQKICIETESDGAYSTSRTSEINNFTSPLYLQHASSTNIIACVGGGNFSIGSSSPLERLHVQGNSYNTGYVRFSRLWGHHAPASASSTWANIVNSNYLLDFPDTTVVTSGHEQFVLKWGNQISGQGYITRYYINSYRDSLNWGWMVFRVTNTDAGTSGRTLRIGGNGTAAWNGTAFNCSGSITAKSSSSDIRLKQDIQGYDALTIIRTLRSVKYHWNAVARANAEVFRTDGWQYGLIAQEVQSAGHTQWVKDVFGDYLTIDYERLTPVLWRGVQQVDDEVTELKRRVHELEQQVISLTNK